MEQPVDHWQRNLDCVWVHMGIKATKYKQGYRVITDEVHRKQEFRTKTAANTIIPSKFVDEVKEMKLIHFQKLTPEFSSQFFNRDVNLSNSKFALGLNHTSPFPSTHLYTKQIKDVATLNKGHTDECHMWVGPHWPLKRFLSSLPSLQNTKAQVETSSDTKVPPPPPFFEAPHSCWQACSQCGG